nr:MAG TPA: hypothetical protein [Caudoviricetes sp.]
MCRNIHFSTPSCLVYILYIFNINSSILIHKL